MGEMVLFLLRVGIPAAVVALAAGAAAGGPADRHAGLTRATVRLCAHRGGKGLWPESTLLAYREVSKHFPSVLLEGDARLTADGHIVLMHDDTVDRTTNGQGAVAQFTLAEIKALDAGYRFTQDDGKSFPYRGQGITVPTFEEALQTLPDAVFLIELKRGSALPEAMIALLRRMNATQRVILASFHEALLQVVRKTAPEIATCFTFGSGIRMLQALRDGDWAAYTPEDLLLALPDELEQRYALTAEEIRAIQAKGVLVQVHTVNRHDEMVRLLELGVDSIITDYPDVLAEVLAQIDRPSQGL